MTVASISGIRRVLAGTALVGMLTSCGGGGSDSAPVATVPAPTPTPSPSPSASPSPAATTARFQMVGAGALVGTVIFDVNGNGSFAQDRNDPTEREDIVSATDRLGFTGRDVPERLAGSEPPAAASAAIEASGVDAITGFAHVGVRAPKGATVVSPVGTLMRTVNDNTVAINLGLGSSAADILAFDTVAALSGTGADAATVDLGWRLTALNLKLLTFAGFHDTTGFGPSRSIVVAPNLSAVAERARQGRLDLNDAQTLRDLLDRSGVATRAATAQQRNAAARLLARWGQVIDAYGVDGTVIAPWDQKIATLQYAMRFVVLPELMALFASNTAATDRVDALTAGVLRDRLDLFTGVPRSGAAGRTLMATADYLSFRRMEIRDTLTLDPLCTTTATVGPQCNDVTLGVGAALLLTGLRVTAVRVPGGFADRILVSLSTDGTIAISRMSRTDPAIVWFDYDVQNARGETGTSRYFIRLNDDI